MFVPMIDGWQKYGPACIGLDVQAVLAEYYRSQNSLSFLPEIKSVCQKELDGLDNLSRDEKSLAEQVLAAWKGTTTHQKPSPPVEMPECLRQEGGDPYQKRHRSSLTPEIEQQREDLLRSLKKSSGKTQDNQFSRQSRHYPLLEDGNVSIAPNHWGELLPPTGLLQDWIKYVAVKQLLKIVPEKTQTFPHEFFPYLKSVSAEYVEGLYVPLVTAPETKGKTFLVLRIRDLDLLCYLRTHNEHEFLHITGRDDTLQPLRNFIGYDHPSGNNLSTGSLWNSETLLQDLQTLCPISKDTDCTLVNVRYLPSGSRYSVDYWEKNDYYTHYRYFERSREERDAFLTAILAKGVEIIGEHESVKFSDEFCWYLPEEHRNEVFPDIVRFTVMGFIHGFSAKIIADQLRKRFGKLIPKGIHGHDFDVEIEKMLGILLGSFRFRGLVGDYLYSTLLPKLCLDPVIQRTCMEGCYVEKLEIDGIWKRDKSKSPVIDDPMARDAVGDITDRNIFSRNPKSDETKKRWKDFLLPLLEERCRGLGIKNIVPGNELFERLNTTNAISRNGKPGRPVYEVEKPYTCWMETLDDVKKAIGYALVRHGVKLLAVTKESFVVEIALDQTANSHTTLINIVRHECETILGLPPDQWGNLIEAETLAHWPMADHEQKKTIADIGKKMSFEKFEKNA